MIPIIQENRKPSFRDRLGAGLGAASQQLPQILQQIQQQQERSKFGNQIKEQFGIDLPKEGMEEFTKAFGKGAGESHFKKNQESSDLIKRGKESIGRIREIMSQGNTGWNVFNYATKEGRTDRAAMDTAALNLERLAVEMQGKGVLSKPRFEYMVKRLPSSLKSDEANHAILDEWENILSNPEEDPSQENSSVRSKIGKRESSVPVMGPNGIVKMIPKSQVKAAMKAGGKVQK